eukprot:TRINITY_DN4638_c0_g2_i21.p4 TRINITY_DN4638_c0_g2~~TRINITY_DN4638_c0_g2_i21.p4  ORF type:complete len:101 (+),score=10.02 TRINITY_DN4638_c0_g2_i21:60-362(+)
MQWAQKAIMALHQMRSWRCIRRSPGQTRLLFGARSCCVRLCCVHACVSTRVPARSSVAAVVCVGTGWGALPFCCNATSTSSRSASAPTIRTHVWQHQERL